MFAQRLGSSIILVLITLITLIMGGPLLFATIVAISLIGMTELYKVYNINKTTIAYLGYIMAVAYNIVIFLQKDKYNLMMIILFFLFLMITYVFSYPKYSPEQIMVVFFGMFYLAVMMSYIYQVRELDGGKWLVWLIFISAWGCDTCAYCVGVLFGKHKMAPKLSPKKSIEGGIGGLIGATILGAIYASVANKYLPNHIQNPVLLFAIVGFVGGIISQIGDLTASAIKRSKDVKDYGTLIPGHGGILDRFDSIIFIAPIVYYFTIFLG